LLYCALDTARNRLEFTSAGHPMPLLQDLNTNEIITLGTEEDSGLPLGISEDETYRVVTADIPENSRLVLYSDGLAEAFPMDCKEYGQFGEKGIFASLKASAHLSVEEAMEKLFADSAAFTGGSGRHDDTSLVLVQRTNGRH